MKRATKIIGSAVIASTVLLIATHPLSPSVLATVPGAVNPDITQANIDQTICNPNWSTKSIRPTSAYTTKLKIQQLKDLGWSDQKTADYEEDHLISLELGGNPTDPKNLWPEKYAEPNGAKDKDKIENYLHAQVCAGKLTLIEAQKEISTDWTKVQVTPTFGGTSINDTDDEEN